MSESLERPWLIAVWPGMGNVALTGGTYLLQQLTPDHVADLPAHDVFDVERIEVKDGIAKPGRLPRNMFFAFKDPQGRRDLLIFIGESQPSTGGYGFCHRILDYALEYGVERVVTFAAMATQMQPGTTPRVFGAATNAALLERFKEREVEVLTEGEISGLNGVLLGVAAERGIEAGCLLGELPYFAVGMPNPGASQAVLEVFASLASLDIDFAELSRQAETVDQRLQELVERMGRDQGDDEEGEESGFSVSGPLEGEEGETAEEVEPELDAETEKRIETLFEQARRDRAQAAALKRELDRLGVFRRYEDRFLDLFKRGE